MTENGAPGKVLSLDRYTLPIKLTMNLAELLLESTPNREIPRMIWARSAVGRTNIAGWGAVNHPGAKIVVSTDGSIP